MKAHVLTASATIFLAACGGGGSSDPAAPPGTSAAASSPAAAAAPASAAASAPASPPPAASAPASAPASPVIPGTPAPPVADLVTAVTPPTYATGSAELGAWKVLQDERGACGFGLLQQDTRLDQAAAAHAKYLVDYSLASGLSYIGHGEQAGTPGFTGIAALDRAVAAGWPALSSSIDEILDAQGVALPTAYPSQLLATDAKGAASMRLLMATAYHLVGAMSEGRLAGAAAAYGRGAYAALSGYDAEVYRFGALIGTIGTSTQRLGGQVVATYPCAAASHVAAAFAPASEAPNPFPDVTSTSTVYGTPILFKVDAGQALTLSLVTVTGPGGASTATRTLNAANDPAHLLAANMAIVIPTQALVAGSSYNVLASGAIDGKAFSRAFAFTVAP